MATGTRFDDTIDEMTRIDQRGLLCDVSVPVLICHGRHDLDVPVTMAEHLAAGLADSRVVIFDSSGHTPLLEEPEAFLAELTELLGETLPE